MTDAAPSSSKAKDPNRVGGTCVTLQQVDLICQRLAEGRSLISISKDDDMPSHSSIYEALANDKTFADKYARAREVQADKLASEIIEIADDGKRDYVIDPDNGIVVDHDHIARSRLRVDARKWAASKLAPKKYGDRVALGGADDMPPIALTGDINIRFVNPDSSGGEDA